MKTKLQLSENNLISLIKRVILEQDDMNSTNYLNQIETERQQKLKTQPIATKQKSIKYCPTYQEVDSGPYFMCSQSAKIIPIQKYFKLNPDGKFGIDTLNVVYKNFGKTSLTDTNINEFNSSVKDYENVSNTPYTPSKPLTTYNNKKIKISNTNYLVESIYASYKTKWGNGDFVIYINVHQPGSLGGVKYKFGTSCSLLDNGIMREVGKTTNYTFNDLTIANNIKTHFCQKKSNQA